jgi:hypothetical protein
MQGSPRSLDQRRNSERKLTQHLTQTPSCEALIRRREQASKDYETNKAEIERFAAARKAKRDYLIKIGAEI